MKNEQTKTTAKHQEPQVPIAIVGIGCIFPNSHNLQEYWAMLREGDDAITDVPSTYWDVDDYFDSDPKTPDHVYAKRGAFLPEIEFNPLEFGIVPNALEATDTSQLLSLVAAQEALKDAGYTEDRDFDCNRVSVILGVTGTLEMVIPLGARLGHPIWRRALKDAGIDDAVSEDVIERIRQSYVDWQEASFPGLLGNVVAGRIANRFDFGGTNCSVDAACASSLSALHLASLELASGKSDMVLTGGVDTFNHVFMYTCFSKTPALSPSGHARPFDHQADGTTLGEGIGIIAVKRLDDARRDGNKIYAVVKGIGSSSDGKGTAIYAPSSKGQVKAFRSAYERSGVSPDTIELMEAHGTGTKVGDATEIQSMTEVYQGAQENGIQKNGPWCALGSVKSQIGHTKSAAGIAGLIKTALALYHKTLPPTIKVEKPAPGLDNGPTPFYVNTEKRPWLASPDHPRRAAVSAFGFGGSNFHCVLEEAEPQKNSIDWSGRMQIMPFSASTPDELQTALDQIETTAPWPKIRSNAAHLRRQFNVKQPHRLVIVLEKGKSDLAKMLSNAKKMLSAQKGKTSWSTPDGIYYGSGSVAGPLGIIFPGQGAQYVGMLRDLACQFPQFQEVLSTANAIFQDNQEGPTSHRLSDLIYPRPTFNEAAQQHNAEVLQSTQVAQPAIGAVSLGLLRVLEWFGVRPEYVAGHSYGELVALCAAGVLDTETFFVLSKRRGQLMGQRKGDKGSMLAVQADEDTVNTITQEEQLDLVIANKNSPQQTVLSGATSEIERARDIFKRREFRCKQLSVAAAFHSKFVSDASGTFLETLQQVELHPPKLPVYANSTAERYSDDVNQIREILAGQLANPVEFIDIIKHMYSQGVRTFVEVGPSAQISGLMKAILEGKEVNVFSVDASIGQRSGENDLARTLAQFATLGYQVHLINWDDVVPAEDGEQPTQKRSMTILLRGANYVKPRTPKPPVKRQITQSETPPKTFPSEQLSASQTPALPQQPQPPSVQTQIVHNESVVPPQGPAASPMDIATMLQITQENLRTLQQFQEQTANLHRQFLEGQEAARQSFDRLLEQQQRLMQGLPLSAATPQQEQLPSPKKEPATAPAQSIQLPMSSAPAVQVPTPQFATTGTESQPSTSAPQTTPPSNGKQQITTFLLDVVAEKTGYPADMLELDMGLDADLGIDSIKRVEILSALQQRLPHLPEVGSDKIGQIQTLGQIVELLGANGSSAPVTVATPIGTDSSALTSTLLDVVAEKTGYPADMLELDMGLDADLGIDSIKRVEILSALQQRLPHLPEVKSEQMGSIQTLGQIVELLGSNGSGNAKSAAAPATPQTVSLDIHQLTDALLDVVAEKTGYPADMLELDMGLDADLGIDSIKRVEILSALQQRLPHLPEVRSEQMGQIQTLRQIVEALGNGNGTPKILMGISENSMEIAGAEPIEVETLTRSIIVPISLSNKGRTAISLSSDAPIWVTDDSTPLSEALVWGLREKGFQTERIAWDDIQQLSSPECLSGLVILAPSANALSENFLKDAFQLVQAAGSGLRHGDNQGKTMLVTVSRLDGVFGFDTLNVQTNPLSGGLAGLVKTAAHEWPEVHCKAIDLAADFADTDTAANRLLDELFFDGPIEVGISAQGVKTLELRQELLTADSKQPLFNKDDVIVITGGARGVTAECAVMLAKASQSAMILLGRSPAPVPEEAWMSALTSETEIQKAVISRATEKLTLQAVRRQVNAILANREIQNTLTRIEAASGRAHYYSVDVRDADAAQAILADAQQQFGTITGLIHGAGVLADRRIEEKTPEQFASVYDTKVKGLQALLKGLNENPLKAQVYFSSTTARVGRTGQVDYAIANEVLNKIAQQQSRLRPECRVMSINWGPWAGGMVTPELEKLFAQEGIGLISYQAGAEYLIQELSNADGPVEVVVLNSDLPATETLRKIPVNGRIEATVSSSLPVVFERTLALDEHPFLRSHVINGQAVLPAAISMEWLAHGALHSNPGLRFHGFNNFQILKGVILTNGHSHTVRILAGKARKEGNLYVVPVEMQGLDNTGREMLHVRAECLLSAQLPQEQPAINELDTEAYPHKNGDIYRKYLFHGPDFHGIQEVEGCSTNGIIAKTKAAPHPSAWIKQPLRNHWLTDPLVVDSSFQMLILWSYQRYQAASLPTAVGRYRQFQAKFPEQGGRVVAQVVKSTQHQAIANIEFLDQDGALVARMENYECVIDPSLNRAFRQNSLAGEERQ